MGRSPHEELAELRAQLAELRRQVAALEENERRCRIVVENTRDAEFWISPEGLFLFASPSYRLLYGRDAAEFLADPTLQLRTVHSEDREAFERHVSEEATRVPGELEFRIVRPDGTVRWVEHVCQPMFDERGVYLGIRGSNRDVTARKRAEERLRESEERLRSVLRSSATGTFEFDLLAGEGRWNDVEFELLGLKPGDAPGNPETFFRHVHPDDVEALRAAWETALQTGELDADFRIVRADGQERWLAGKGRFTFEPGAGGPPVRFLGVNFDITERKLAEQRLFAATQRLTALMNALPVGVSFSDDATCEHITGNPAVLAQFGVGQADNLSASATDAEAPGRQVRFFRDGELITDAELPLQRAVAENAEILPMELEVRLPGGRTWYAVASGAPIRDAQGRVTGGVAVTMDITARRLAEKKLQQSEALYRSIGESIDYGVWVCDPDGRNTYASESFLRMAGITQEQCSNFGWGDVLHLDDADRTIAAWQECVRTGGIWDIEHRVRGADGQWHDVLARGVPVRDEQGEITGWVGINLDISRRKRAENNLRENEERLRGMVEELARSNKELEQFAYVASHDLQEPLRMVTAFTGLLADRYRDRLDARADEYIAYALEGATRMQKLIDDLLAYSRLGGTTVGLPVTNAAEALRNALTNLEESLAATGAEVTADPLPTVAADATLLAQVFQNLIGNSVKYRRTDVVLEIHVGAERRQGEWLLSVRDNGIGIDPQYFDRIFEIFQRLHSRKEYPGTGVGLAICRKVVERHGGRIWVESRLGQGSTFSFTIPDAPAAAWPRLLGQ